MEKRSPDYPGRNRFTALFGGEIELLMAESGIEVTYETIRTWCARLGPQYARWLRRHRPRAGDKWLPDEVFIKIGGVQKYLWWAVDQHGDVFDILIQSNRDGEAVTRFFKKLLKQQGSRLRVLITNKLPSCQARAPHRDADI